MKCPTTVSLGIRLRLRRMAIAETITHEYAAPDRRHTRACALLISPCNTQQNSYSCACLLVPLLPLLSIVNKSHCEDVTGP